MENKIKRQTPNQDNLPSAPGQDSFLTVIERLSTNPDVDVAKIKQFVEMQEHILDRNAKQAFNAAMTKAQNRIELVVAESENKQTNSNYANLKAVLLKAKPIYTDEGFSLMYYEGETTKEKHKRVAVDIMHEQGHTEQRYVDVAIQTTGIAGKAMMTEIHGEGSAFSYGRRYLTCMIFNIPTGDDDDGNAASTPPEYINTDQATTINDLIKKTGADVKKFLKVAKAESVDKILRSEYPMLIKQLQKKRDNMRQPGDE